MPTATNDGVALFYEVAGSGETVAFVEDVGYGAWSWGWQAPALAGPFETLVWDNRGTGRSDAPPGPYTVETMAADLEAVLSAHGARRAHLVGAGLGGMIALAHARRHDRADRLVLVGSAARGAGVDARAQVGDPRDTLDAVTSEEFRTGHPDAVERIVAWRREEDAGADAAAAQVAAVDAFDATGWLHEVTNPALVLHGAADAVVPAEAGVALAEGLPNGRLEAFEAGSHLVHVEQSRLVTDAIVGFLEADGEG